MRSGPTGPRPEPKPPQARHGFLPVVLYLERMLGRTVRVGENGPVADEGIRFQHDATLQFSTSDVREIVKRGVVTDDDRTFEHYLLTTTFLGLTGGVSPLPDYIPDEVAKEDGDEPLRRRFLDIFHHRLVSLLYRGIVKYHYQSEFVSGGKDPWSRRILCLTGLDAFAEPAPEPEHWEQWLRISPLLVAARRGPRTLQLALADELGEDLGDAEVRIEEFVGDWVEIDDRQLFRLGMQAHALGRDAILGRRIFDRSAKFRIHISPISYGVFRQFQGESGLRARVDRIVRSVIHEPFDYDLALDLADGQAPGMRLSRNGGHALGQDTWLGKRQKLDTTVVMPALSKV